MTSEHAQSDYAVRFDWGLAGAETVGRGADVAVVVDVLSFTTTLTVAADRGVDVFPYPWNDDGAARFAADRDATLAVGRSRARGRQVSLSPGTVRAAHDLRRLVLPSPNGSTIAHASAAASRVCVGASLRNATAVGQWLADRCDEQTVVTVIAAGERWEDGSLRPAVEDLWGAGAVVAALIDHSPDLAPSPEALVASSAWSAVADRIESSVRECASGRELIAAGYASDVAVAVEVDGSRSVPVLVDGCFRSDGG